MTLREQVTLALDDLSDEQLRQVADYVAFLRFRSRLAGMPSLAPEELAALYGEFAEEDQLLAEEGLAEYSESLREEDTR